MSWRCGRSPEQQAQQNQCCIKVCRSMEGMTLEMGYPRLMDMGALVRQQLICLMWLERSWGSREVVECMEMGGWLKLAWSRRRAVRWLTSGRKAVDPGKVSLKPVTHQFKYHNHSLNRSGNECLLSANKCQSNNSQYAASSQQLSVEANSCKTSSERKLSKWFRTPRGHSTGKAKRLNDQAVHITVRVSTILKNKARPLCWKVILEEGRFHQVRWSWSYEMQIKCSKRIKCPLYKGLWCWIRTCRHEMQAEVMLYCKELL